MIIYSGNEIEYIKNECQIALKYKDSENTDTENIEDREYKEYIKNQGEEIWDKIDFCMNNIHKINEDKEVNEKITNDIVYWYLGIWVWFENEFTRDEVYFFVPDNIFCDLYEKIRCEEEESDEE